MTSCEHMNCRLGFKIYQRNFYWSLLLGLCMLLCFSVVRADALQSQLSEFADANLTKKTELLQALLQNSDQNTLAAVTALLDGKLYVHKADAAIVIFEKKNADTMATPLAGGESIFVQNSSEYKKIFINNQLRNLLKAGIAQLSLSSLDPTARRNAITEMMGNIDPSAANKLAVLAKQDEDSMVRTLARQALNINALHVGDDEKIIQAMQELQEDLHPEVKNQIGQFLALDSNGEYLQKNPKIREAAERTLENIESKIKYYEFLQTAFFGLGTGAVLVLAAIGLAITFGVMGVINMAHGELIMLGAYTTYLIQQWFPSYIDYSILLAIPAAFIVSGMFGILIERGVIRFLYGRPLDTLLATFGISLILQQLVRTTISAQNVPVVAPFWLSGAYEVNAVFSLTYNRIYIIGFTILVIFGLVMILKKTSLGLQVRAVAQNRVMAKAMGIRTGWVDAMTFGLGSGIAGLAGVALSQLTNVGPNLGQTQIIDSFMVVVFGGVGNLMGTLVAGTGLGEINKFLEPSVGAVMAKILVLIGIILFIQKRPKGLFPQKGRNVEN